MATNPPSTIPSKARTSCTRYDYTSGHKNATDLRSSSQLTSRQRLKKQLEDLKVPFTDDFSTALTQTDHIVDAIFGFSFSGEVREPFPKIIEALASTSVPVLAVDAPSSWDIEDGPRDAGPGKGFMPPALISLTAPKPLVRRFRGRHFIGGRFLSAAMAEKYGLDVPGYEGLDQVVEVPVDGEKL